MKCEKTLHSSKKKKKKISYPIEIYWSLRENHYFVSVLQLICVPKRNYNNLTEPPSGEEICSMEGVTFDTRTEDLRHVWIPLTLKMSISKSWGLEISRWPEGEEVREGDCLEVSPDCMNHMQPMTGCVCLPSVERC